MKYKLENSNFFRFGIDSIINQNTTDFDVIALESLHDTARKDEELESYYIKSYLETAKVLQKALYQKNQVDIPKEQFPSEPLSSLPFLYLCKHVIELSIKFRLDVDRNNNTHDLLVLRDKLPKNISDRLSIGDFNILINTLEFLDCCGDEKPHYALKYSRDTNKNKSENKNGVIAVNTSEIIKTVEAIFNLLVKGEDAK